jgi:hypothetical protein
MGVLRHACPCTTNTWLAAFGSTLQVDATAEGQIAVSCFTRMITLSMLSMHSEPTACRLGLPPCKIDTTTESEIGMPRLSMSMSTMPAHAPQRHGSPPWLHPVNAGVRHVPNNSSLPHSASLTRSTTLKFMPSANMEDAGPLLPHQLIE